METYEEFEEERIKNDEILQAKMDKLRSKTKRTAFVEAALIAALIGGYAAANSMNLDQGTMEVIRNAAIATSGVSIGFAMDKIRKIFNNMEFVRMNMRRNAVNAAVMKKAKEDGKSASEVEVRPVSFDDIEEYARKNNML